MRKFFCLALLAAGLARPAPGATPPVRLAIYGLAHDHVRGFLPTLVGRTDVQLVGMVEGDPKLAAEVVAKFHLDPALVFPSFQALRAKTKFDAVATFTSTFDHLQVVRDCAAAGVPVMMEKPMAVSFSAAQEMEKLARDAGIPVVVNFETTWYPSNHTAYRLVHEEAVGELRKIVVHDGHSGPARICSPYFMAWLGDPVLNGGGALMDFGCYGADLVTWLMDGRRPESVFAVTQNLQPEVYRKVDDEATLVLTYPHAQAIIQASWNWPAGRKDMEIYGKTGALRLPNRDSIFQRIGDAPETPVVAPALSANEADSVSYFAAVARHEIKPTGLSSIEINVTVCEILDAAKESARTGRRVFLPAKQP